MEKQGAERSGKVEVLQPSKKMTIERCQCRARGAFMVGRVSLESVLKERV